MEFKKASVDIHDDLISQYRTRSFDELKQIIPKWAYGLHADKVLDVMQLPTENRFAIYLVQTAELIPNSEFCEVDCTQIFNGISLNDARIARIFYRWEHNLYVDPPSISLSPDRERKVVYADGRHRAKISCLLGHKEIPLAIDLEDIDAVVKFSVLLRLK